MVRTTDFKYNQRLNITTNRRTATPSIAVNAARAASATNTHDPLTTINSNQESIWLTPILPYVPLTPSDMSLFSSPGAIANGSPTAAIARTRQRLKSEVQHERLVITPV